MGQRDIPPKNGTEQPHPYPTHQHLLSPLPSPAADKGLMAPVRGCKEVAVMARKGTGKLSSLAYLVAEGKGMKASA